MAYELKFWNGYRESDVVRAFELDTPYARDFKDAAHVYYRLFNDGDTPHHAKFQRLCKAAGMIRWSNERTDHETQDDLMEALLDRALFDAQEAAFDAANQGAV